MVKYRILEFDRLSWELLYHTERVQSRGQKQSDGVGAFASVQARWTSWDPRRVLHRKTEADKL